MKQDPQTKADWEDAKLSWLRAGAETLARKEAADPQLALPLEVTE